MTTGNNVVKEHMEICPNWPPKDARAVFLGLSIAGEAGELANNIKKEWRDDADLYDKIVKELGDVGAYCLMLAEHLEVNFMNTTWDRLLEFEKRPEYPELLRKAKERAAQR